MLQSLSCQQQPGVDFPWPFWCKDPVVAFVSKTQFSARVRFPLSSVVIGCLAQRVEPDHIKRSYFGNSREGRIRLQEENALVAIIKHAIEGCREKTESGRTASDIIHTYT